MQPSLETLLRRRQVTRMVLRAAAVVLAVLAVVVPLLFLAVRRWDYVGYTEESLAPGYLAFFAFGLAAAGLFTFNVRLAKWIVAPQRPVCPECDYALPGDCPEKCPECGIKLR